ncbi:MAG: alpha/beta hydrolase-fold protein [Archangium sp.]|nr:alpha/beta hydrolase-fold protein [Archangium sp.]
MEVRVVTELWKREPPRHLTRVAGGWELQLGELPVDRLEYELELTFSDGSREWRTDPRAPRVEAPFGPKSVLVHERYRAPSWVTQWAPHGKVEPLEGAFVGQLWTAAGLAPTQPAPLLVAHDGPEYARFSSLLHFLEVAVAKKKAPPLRAVLLAPRARNDDYSAAPAYADLLAHEVLPALATRAPCTMRFGLGASLGALALLHAHRRHPGLFHGLALQSGSFFQHELDVHERGFPHFARIDAFVREVAATRGAPVPVVISCGTGEENLANNRAMAQVLEAQQYPVEFVTARDGHTWTCWRDTLEASLGRLLGLG